MPGDLTEVVDMVIDDIVMVIDVLGTGSITRQKNPRLSQMRQFTIGNSVSLRIQV